jgi:hypothetical protein
MIAVKFEEIYAPELGDYVYITDNSCSKRDIIECERTILHQLDFRVSLPLPLHFLRRYSALTHASAETHTTGKYLLEHMLTEYALCHVSPSLQAATAVWLARVCVHSAGRPLYAPGESVLPSTNSDVWVCCARARIMLIVQPTILQHETGLLPVDITPYVRVLAMHVRRCAEPNAKCAVGGDTNTNTTIGHCRQFVTNT